MKISCSAELSMKKVLLSRGLVFLLPFLSWRKICLLINTKMPIIVGIFIFISRQNHAQLSWAWKKFYYLGVWYFTAIFIKEITFISCGFPDHQAPSVKGSFLKWNNLLPLLDQIPFQKGGLIIGINDIGKPHLIKFRRWLFKSDGCLTSQKHAYIMLTLLNPTFN